MTLPRDIFAMMQCAQVSRQSKCACCSVVRSIREQQNPCERSTIILLWSVQFLLICHWASISVLSHWCLRIRKKYLGSVFIFINNMLCVTWRFKGTWIHFKSYVEQYKIPKILPMKLLWSIWMVPWSTVFTHFTYIILLQMSHTYVKVNFNHGISLDDIDR